MAQFVNMHKVELSNSVAPVVSLRQIFYGDVAANRIGAIVQMNGAPVALGGTCSGTAILADGSTVALTGTVSGNEAYVVLPAGCYSIEGQIQVFVKLTVSGVTTTLLAAVGTVRLTETDQIIDPGTIIPSVAALISDISDAVASIPADYSALLDSVAHTFSSSTAYTAGQYVWYEGELYRFNAAHPAGAWIGTDAARYTATDEFPLIQQALGNKADAAEVADLKSAFDDIVVTTTSPNLYNPTVCNPADLHTYNSSGAYTESSNYATSGKIPVEAETQYTFSANGTVKNVRYFGGDNGETFISGENTTGTFTTPALCTFVAVQLFAAAHTTEQYNAAIAVAQLELGDEATPYQPYGTESHILLESIDKGEELGNFVTAIESANADDVGKVVSPKTITDGVVTEWEFKALDSSSAIDEITETKQSKNLYNPATCNPADKYTYNSSGAYAASDYFATSGKIPVDAETQYIFSAGGARVKNVRYFKGETGETFISGENVDDGPFTTPALCTFVAVQLFSAAHTTEQYEAAIAVAQLEKGAIATPYEPYGETHYVPLSAVEDGEQLSGLSNLVAEQSQINLYDKSLAVNGKYYYTDGSVQTSADWAITGFIPVEPNTQYNISRNPDTPMALGGTVKMYDANQSYIGNASLGNYVYDSLYAFVTGPTTRYIGVGLKLTSHTEQDFTVTINTVMLCYGTQRPLVYSAYSAKTVIPADRMSNAYQDNPDCFTGKKWLATGTSITWYDGKIYADGEDAGDLCRGYVGNVTRRKKLLVTNEGISGSTLGDVSQYSLINRYTTLDWANSDIATIEYGVNDLGNSVPVGTAADAPGTTTFAACLKTVIEYALTQNPRLCLVICTEPDVRGNNTNTNSNGNTLKDYSDVTLEIAAQYRLPVCDWYYHGGFNTLTKGTNKLTIEGTHPNNTGHMRMGAMLNQVFDSLMC